MNIRATLRFAWRYFKSKKSTNAINIISWVSVLAILVGTSSLLIILSAFNGFEELVKNLYSSYYADLKATPVRGKVLMLSQEQLRMLQGTEGVKVVSPSVEEKALLQNGSLQTIVNMRGVDQHYVHLSGVSGKIYHGAFKLGNLENPGIVLGVGVEQALGLSADRSVYPISIYIPQKGHTAAADPMSALGMGVIYPTGSFGIQSEFDNKYAFTNIEFLKMYLHYANNEFNTIEFRLHENANEETVKNALQKILGERVKIENRYEQNRMLYRTIKLEKFAIYGIFTLILIVAAFNMIGSISMLVLEKKKDIQVILSMGANQSDIKKIFLSEGILLGLIGSVGGILISLLLYYIQVTYKLVPLQGATFLIDYYPVKLDKLDFIIVPATVMIISISASWMPSSKAAKEKFAIKN